MSRIDDVGDEPVPVVRHDPKCSVCGGTGWERVYAIHTSLRTSAGGMYREKRWITEAQYNEWMSDPDHLKRWKQQLCYEAVRRCTGWKFIVPEYPDPIPEPGAVR